MRHARHSLTAKKQPFTHLLGSQLCTVSKLNAPLGFHDFHPNYLIIQKIVPRNNLFPAPILTEFLSYFQNGSNYDFLLLFDIEYST